MRRAACLCPFLALVTLLAGCACAQLRRPLARDSIYDRLFPLREPSGDSMPPEPHVPPGAEEAKQPLPTRLPTPASECAGGVEMLAVETVEEGPGGYVADFHLSPSGREMTLMTDDGVVLLDPDTGARRIVSQARDFPLLWVGSSSLVLVTDGGQRLYELDVLSGETRAFEERWEYNSVDLPATKALYTGQQAAKALQVSYDTLYQAVEQGRLETVMAADGTLLLTRDELLAKGAELVLAEHPALLTYDEIAGLRSTAGSVCSVQAIERRSPITDSYWHRILVIRDLPGSRHNLLIHVASESHWEGYPIVENQVPIDDGGIGAWGDAHPDYSVRRDPCLRRQGAGYEYILCRKAPPGQPPIPLGIIPYPHAYWSKMVWSPDWRFIYFKQASSDRHSISRLALP